MAPENNRHRLVALAVCPVVCCLAACGSSMDPPIIEDPCALRPVVDGGSVELGLGSEFTPVVDGQDVSLQLGTQGLWMFVVNARAHDMDVGSGDQEGVVVFSVFDPNGAPVSIDFSCRVREFVPRDPGCLAPGCLELASPYFLPLRPELTGQLDGARLTIQVEVRDSEGHRATDRRTVVAHLPTG